MADFLIRGGCVLTMDEHLGVLETAEVLVQDGRIAQVAPETQSRSDIEIVDASGCIIMPGFIDTHRHLWQTAFRGQLASCTLGDYFRRIMIALAPTITADEVYAATLLGSYQLLDAGITAVVDWANVINTPEHADAGVKALFESGIRGVYAHGWPGGPEYLFHNSLPHPEDARRVAHEYFTSSDQLVTMGLGLRGPASNPPETLKADWDLGRDIGARLNVHAGMRVPGIPSRDITVLDETGLMASDTTYVHCNTTTDQELKRIVDTGGHVSVATYCEMVMGHGNPPTERLLKAGLQPSLSTDIVASSPGDMFSIMRTTLAQARISAFPDDPSIPFDPPITADDVLRFATVNGAQALGDSHRVGTIAPGNDADIIMIRTDRLNALPSVDPIATVVSQVDTSNIDSVWVCGKAVKRSGTLMNVDIAKLRQLADELSNSMRRKLQP